MRRFSSQAAALITLAVALSGPALGGHKKKNEEPKPQVLPLPKEFPRALSAETQSLTFRTTPLLKSGRLSSQIRDTVGALIRDTRGATIVKIRAFVAGAGDSRRVQELIGEMFADKKLGLPVLSIIQVGALDNDAAAVVMEAVVSEHKTVNPNGLAFLAGQTSSSLDGALSRVSDTLKASGLAPGDVVSATCFTSRLTDYSVQHALIAAAFPQAATNILQAMRDPMETRSTCEAIARLPRQVSSPGVSDSPVFTVTAPEIVFTGLQLSFGTYLSDADSALSRLEHDLQAAHSGIRNAVSINAFSLNPAAVSALQKTMGKFSLPANTLTVQPVEGLPSLDAALGMEAILVSVESASATAGGVPQTRHP